MSLIQEALKKSRAEGGVSTPAVDTYTPLHPSRSQQARRFSSVVFGIALLVVFSVAAIYGAVYFYEKYQTEKEVSAAGQVNIQLPIDSLNAGNDPVYLKIDFEKPGESAQPEPAADESQETAKTTPLPVEGKSEEEIVVADHKPAPTVIEAKVYRQKQDSVWPKIKVTGVMISPNAAKSSAVMNGKLLMKGESLMGVQLKEMNANNVTLTYRGEEKVIGIGSSTY